MYQIRGFTPWYGQHLTHAPVFTLVPGRLTAVDRWRVLNLLKATGCFAWHVMSTRTWKRDYDALKILSMKYRSVRLNGDKIP